MGIALERLSLSRSILPRLKERASGWVK